ncbi:Iron(3+)-hydroxamate import ATP-binding protein FhuC [bioreactor metagenome]|jgi:iron complex transport system ATP-binding protein|uniref:Iron(3+)-hydroxamate import ATP-binding protein FhuC n=1 Tax=bioreactor metagenome TaxID=1076179 RepID=A0A644XNQ8_9ZZZZ
MITIRNAHKHYGRQTVVNNVSLAIQANSLTTLIGSNGAGKSTLLSMVGRLVDGQGEFLLEGKPISSFKPTDLAKQLSMLRQSNQVSARLTVRELVNFGRFPYSKTRLTTKDHQLVDQALSFMDLTGFADKYLDQLSGGERQRASIAMVLAQDTTYVLLDEPLNNLDMAHSVHIMKLLRRLVDEHHKTIIVVLHDINFASCYSDYIIAMKDGKLVQHGNTEQVINSERLMEIYGMHIPVAEQGGRRYCLYHL